MNSGNSGINSVFIARRPQRYFRLASITLGISTMTMGEEIQSLARYNYLRQQLPNSLPQHLRRSLTYLADAFLAEQLQTISSIAVVSYNPLVSRPNSIIITAFGTFKRKYACITRLTDILVPFYVQSSILPIVQPITMHEWAQHRTFRTPLYRKLTRSGILLYGKVEQSGS